MNNFLRVTIFAFFLVLLPVSVFAQPFANPGPLDPVTEPGSTCTGPTDGTCYVTLPDEFLELSDTPAAFTNGSILFTSGTAVTEDNTNLFWDDTNDRLGIGTVTPIYDLDVDGVTRTDSVATTSIAMPYNVLRVSPDYFGSLNVSGSLKIGDSIILGNDGRVQGMTNMTLGEIDIVRTGYGVYSETALTTFGSVQAGVDSGDINADGNRDFIVSRQGGDPYIYYGDGSGGFAAPVAVTSVNTWHEGIFLADANNDGWLDVFQSDLTGNAVSVYLNNTTAGGFTFSATQSVSGYAREIVASDIDLDGNMDIVVSSQNGSAGGFSIHYGNGDGTFESEILLSTANRLSNPQVSDINKDGLPDLVSTAYYDDGFYTSLNQGDRNFSAPVFTASGDGARFISLGDFDGDFDNDIFITNRDDNDMMIFENDGSGVFSLNQTFGGLFLPTYVKTMDLNKDGFVDFVVGHSTATANTGFMVGLNNGDGTFTPRDEYGHQIFTYGDFTNNGVIDFVSVTNTGYLPYFHQDTEKSSMFKTDVATGYVGIGTDTPTSKLHVVSDGVAPIATFTDDTHTATCDIDAAGLTCSSDERLKKNVHTFENSLEGLLSLTPVKYLWNTEDEETSKEKIGFKAQDIQRIFPELVKEASNGYLSVNYAGFSPLLTAAIQEMYQDFNDIQPLGKTSATKQITAFLSDAKDKVINGFVFVEEMFANVFLAETAQIDDLQVVEEFCVGETCIDEDTLIWLIEDYEGGKKSFDNSKFEALEEESDQENSNSKDSEELEEQIVDEEPELDTEDNEDQNEDIPEDVVSENSSTTIVVDDDTEVSTEEVFEDDLEENIDEEISPREIDQVSVEEEIPEADLVEELEVQEVESEDDDLAQDEAVLGEMTENETQEILEEIVVPKYDGAW